ncbi:Gfo/Idh/MocA family protein [Paramicrobacterium agarici]|uniref:Gfo/Idh/MocA family protein n=1 Tax=Paramicrobacterium agarici TaxID=630514 RepID=UPI00114FCC73|nr:Gfo/Idh/MocA family oxidoreductase [Microbacterium agarici]TQO23094.1 putative dehydrogenase [Microbacterium agarici]
MRIGLIGAGAVAGYYRHAAQELGIELAAVCDVNTDAAEAAAPAGAQIFGDHRELYESGLVDAVVVNTPHALHAPMTIEAAEAGLHVLVEKPMAISLEECDQMVQAAETSGTTLMVGHIQHYMPDKLAAAAAIAEGEIGQPTLLRDYRTTDYRTGMRSAWFFSKRIAGGGALINIGAHCIDRTLWLAGSWASSVSANVVNRHDVAVETDGIVHLQLQNGATASITVVSDADEYSDELVIVGENGLIVADPNKGTRSHIDGYTRMLWEPDGDPVQQAFTAELNDFSAAIGGVQPSVSLEHARHVIDVVLSAYASAESKAPVALS